MFKNVIEDIFIKLIGGLVFVGITLGLTLGLFYFIPFIIYQLFK